VRGKKSPVAVEEEEMRKKKCDRREEKRIESAVLVRQQLRLVASSAVLSMNCR
jgi:hypothetical protein